MSSPFLVAFKIDSGHVYPLPRPPMMAHPHGNVDGNHHQHQQQQPLPPSNNWAGNDANSVLVLATLLTALTYHLGSSIPGGYWQYTHPAEGGKQPHAAGDPVMRDLHPQRYCVHGGELDGVRGSMLMTLRLLVRVRVPVDSRL